MTIPCGGGPVVTVDGVPRQTSARTTAGELHDLAPVALTLCGPATAALGTGEHRLVATATDTLAVDSATLTRVGSAVAASRLPDGRADHPLGRRGPQRARGRTHRGHAARRPGEHQPGVVGDAGRAPARDGRRRRVATGLVLPAGAAGTVELSFGPGLLYRWALGIGAGAVLLLIALAVVRGRPARPVAPSARRRSAEALVLLAAVAGTAMVGGVVGLGALLVATSWPRWRTATGGGPRRRGGERPGRGGCPAPGRRRRHGDGAPGRWPWWPSPRWSRRCCACRAAVRRRSAVPLSS